MVYLIHTRVFIKTQDAWVLFQVLPVSPEKTYEIRFAERFALLQGLELQKQTELSCGSSPDSGLLLFRILPYLLFFSLLSVK